MAQPSLVKAEVTAANPATVSARLSVRSRYSWRSDPSVPAFNDTHPVIVFDGVCVLCSHSARFVAVRDPARRFRFVAAQGSIGGSLMCHYNLDPVAFETNLLLEDGRAYGKLDAVAGILEKLGAGWRLTGYFLRRLPIGFADWLYDRIARNRYALFGRHDTCVVPGPDWQDRILDEDKGQAK